MPLQLPLNQQSIDELFDTDAANNWKPSASSSAIPPQHYFFQLYGHQVATNGYSILPIPPAQKHCYWRAWTRFCHEPATDEQIARWQRKCPSHGIALLGGFSIVVIDIDCLDVHNAKRIERVARLQLGNTPLKRIGQYPKRALVYAVAAGHVIASQSAHQLDVLGLDRYVIGYGIHPRTAKPYRWVNGSPLTVPVSDLPRVTPVGIERFMAAVKELFPEASSATDASEPAKETPPPTIASTAIALPRSGSGLIMDGRDSFLMKLIYRAWAHHTSPASAADEAWATFSQQADLHRPKRDGRKPWTRQDALAKALALYASGKPRPHAHFISVATSTESWDAYRLRFAQHVDRLCVAGLLTRTDAKISHAMLGFVRERDGSCFASTQTVADHVNCRPSSVKKARRQLRQLRLWTATHTKGGRGLLAHYQPCLTFPTTASNSDVCARDAGVPTALQS